MNVGGIVSKIEANAELATIAAGFWLRSKETDNPGLMNIIQTSLFETVKTFSTFELIKYKLWDAGHTPQALTKLGLGIWAASELGLINKKALGKKIIKGGVIASIATPGSGPASPLTNNFLKAPTAASYSY